MKNNTRQQLIQRLYKEIKMLKINVARQKERINELKSKLKLECKE